MLQTIAIHDVVPEHAEAFLAFMRRVEAAVAGREGLIDFGSYREPATNRLVGVGRWSSLAAFEAAMPAIVRLSAERRPEWTEGDDELLVLVTA